MSSCSWIYLSIVIESTEYVQHSRFTLLCAIFVFMTTKYKGNMNLPNYLHICTNIAKTYVLEFSSTRPYFADYYTQLINLVLMLQRWSGTKVPCNIM